MLYSFTSIAAGAQSDNEVDGRGTGGSISDRGYTSDSELYEQRRSSAGSKSEDGRPASHGSWLMVGIYVALGCYVLG